VIVRQGRPPGRQEDIFSPSMQGFLEVAAAGLAWCLNPEALAAPLLADGAAS